MWAYLVYFRPFRQEYKLELQIYVKTMHIVLSSIIYLITRIQTHHLVIMSLLPRPQGQVVDFIRRI